MRRGQDVEAVGVGGGLGDCLAGRVGQCDGDAGQSLLAEIDVAVVVEVQPDHALDVFVDDGDRIAGGAGGVGGVAGEAGANALAYVPTLRPAMLTLLRTATPVEFVNAVPTGELSGRVKVTRALAMGVPPAWRVAVSVVVPP